MTLTLRPALEATSPGGRASPLGTPATARAARIAREGMAAAESLSSAGLPGPAAEMKAASLEAAAAAYSKAAATRLPLRQVVHSNGVAISHLQATKPTARVDDAGDIRSPATSSTRVPVAEIKAVIISGASLVRHAPEGTRPFTLFQLHVPLSTGEHIAFRRFVRTQKTA